VLGGVEPALTLGDADCCAKCGMGDIWHSGDRSTIPGKWPHRFIKPLIIGTKVVMVGDRFYYNFPGNADFPTDPKGWVKCIFKDTEGKYGLIVKPKGHEKFIISRNEPERFRLEELGEMSR
jgi:hypothetical protein